MKRLYFTDLVTDPTVIQAATAAGIAPLRLAQVLGSMSQERINGLRAYATQKTTWGKSAADVRAEFDVPPAVTNQEIEGAMEWLGITTDAAVFDPGS